MTTRTDPIETETTWKIIKNTIINIQERDIGHITNKAKKDWMTTDILALMDEWRQLNGKHAKYKELNRTIRKKCREAKEKLLVEKYQEIEQLQVKYDTFNMHKKIKEMANRNNRRHTTILKNHNNEVIVGT